MLTKNSFNFAELDAKATYLDLKINAVEIFDVAICEVAHEVACLVKTTTRIGTEGIGNKAFGRQLRPFEIAARQSCATDIEFAGHADRRRLQRLIKYINLSVSERLTDRRHGVRRKSLHGGPDRRFSWTIKVPDLRTRVYELVLKVAGHRFAATKHLEGWLQLDASLEQHAPRGRSALQHCRTQFDYFIAQQPSVTRLLPRNQTNTRSDD